MMSERISSFSPGACGWCFTVARAHVWSRHSGGSFTGMPWFSPITSALHAIPISTIDMPRSTRLRAQNASTSTYEATSNPNPMLCQ